MHTFYIYTKTLHTFVVNHFKLIKLILNCVSEGKVQAWFMLNEYIIKQEIMSWYGEVCGRFITTKHKVIMWLAMINKL